MEHLRPKLMIFDACAGAALGYCIHEAIAYSAAHQVDVEFVHNDRTFRVNFAEVIAACKEIHDGE